MNFMASSSRGARHGTTSKMLRVKEPSPFKVPYPPAFNDATSSSLFPVEASTEGDDDDDTVIDSHIPSGSEVYISDLTREAIGVVKLQWHPSVYKEHCTERQGLSLVSFFGNCYTSDGKRKLYHLLSYPITDRTVLEYRLDMGEFFGNPRNQVFTGELSKHIKHVQNLRSIFKKMATKRCAINEWRSIYTSLVNLVQACGLLTNYDVPTRILDKITTFYDKAIPEICHKIPTTINFQASHNGCDIVINSGVSSLIDDCKEQIEINLSLLDDAFQHEKEWLVSLGFPDAAYWQPNEKCCVTFVKQVGFLLKVPLFNCPTVDHLLDRHPGSDIILQRIFTTNEGGFYKTNQTVRLDLQQGDPVSALGDLQIQVLVKLQEEVIAAAGPIQAINEVITEIDW